MRASLIFFFTLAGLHAHIELVTVPKSENTQLTIYNSADITMVKESRALTFKEGDNTIQFSWAGTLIDPTSLRLTFLDHKSQLALVETTFPQGRNDALQWRVKSHMSGSAKIEINYFTSGISWNADYTAITDGAEKAMKVDGFVRIINNSGEDFNRAEVRLVVGQINLVENIAHLASGGWRFQELTSTDKDDVKRDFAGRVTKAEAKANLAAGSGAGDDSEEVANEREKSIVKEGLSEYFLFTIEGREKIPNGWQKRMRAFSASDVPVKVIYRASDALTSGKVHKFFEFRNRKEKDANEKTSLGVSPLPDGVVQIFKEDSKHNLSFQGRVAMKYVAKGEKVKLDSGETREVVVKAFLRDYSRSNFKTEKHYDSEYHVKAWVEKFFYGYELENTLARPVHIEIEKTFADTFEPESIEFRYEKVNASTIRFFPELAAGERKKVNFSIRIEHRE